ncbi:heparin/heparin-sulfate lyase HepB [Paenibacillus allorhizosphaerae]|uniref:Heparin and heparin-sulfate lyase n=1 Tax=Paenibacillus allorhizosphaerae TaxID=2849866 RepID=A0ABM8VFZ0_9BACL|nr:heparin/heparin-sulfate lyase HepB [Paenibacillus allorhizosphaerae]CAG7636363.1 Heparin and heparin-sulfate lyase [Paenibacillus allorhizosphaerae]
MYPQPPHIPPQEHPRLLIRSEDVPALREKRAKPEMKQVWERLTRFSQVDICDAYSCESPGDVYLIEANALMYVLDGDQEAGFRAKQLAMRSLTKPFNSSYQDISRSIGRLMLAAAVVYDWCRELISDEERRFMIGHFKRLALLLECGYPPNKEGSIVGHTSEWMLMRDLLGTGIAIYDEDPEIYNLAAGRFYAEMVPPRNFFYPSGWHHQGDNYGSYRYQAELYATWIMDRMGAGNPFDASQENVGYQWIYTRRPDGKLLRDGDSDNPLYAEHEYIRLFPLVYLMAGSYYGNPYFIDQQFREFQTIPDMYVFHAFLFYNADIAPRPVQELPLTRFFGSPMGIMIARTGWDEAMDRSSGTVVAEMRVGEYQYNNHQHLDAGAFQLYYKGYLAIDSGIYKGSSGKYHSPHNKYYFKRSIAHNTVLVYDPDELNRYPHVKDGGLVWPNVNDGGQRWPNEGRPPLSLEELLGKDFKRGEVLAHAFGPDPVQPNYSYLKGDITAAYSDKMKQFQRSFLFLNFKEAEHPAAMIVFDRVVSTKAEFRKYWLLHSVEEPQITEETGRTVISRSEDGYSGQLVNDTLLPEAGNREIVAVGGPGKEYWVFGTNFVNDFPSTKEQGAWRIEVSPHEPAEHDCFLNVMQVKEVDGPPALVTKRVETDALVGARIKDWVVLFSKSGERLQETLTVPVFGLADGVYHNETTQCLIADLAAGGWIVETDGRRERHKVTEAGGVLHLTGVTGEVRLIPGSGAQASEEGK